ncbi:MAG TPA: BlaI/MecI/CopY family transcriptional regulator, partial [Prosthecobacter sp.]|nr:BlaI/MecI/CopY family transcriptional regulator [Prosthecobacter sp.]
KERQAMEILYRLGEATAAQVQAELPDTPNYSAVRALLGVLVEKQHAKITKPEGARHYVYAPQEPIQKARKGALRRLLTTFFDDSPSELVANLLDPAERKMSPAEIERLQTLIDAQRAARKS